MHRGKKRPMDLSLNSDSIVSPGEIINFVQNKIQTDNFNASQPIFKDIPMKIRAIILEKYTRMPTASLVNDFDEHMGCKTIS